MSYQSVSTNVIDGQAAVHTYLLNPTEESRDYAIRAFLPLVKKIIGKVASSDSNILDYDDLLQSGLLGLVEALDRYQLESGTKFITFAYTRIHGAVIDQLRKTNLIGRANTDQLKNVRKAIRKLTIELGREPAVHEICKELKMPEKKYHQLVNISLFSFQNSLDELQIMEDGSHIPMIETIENTDQVSPEEFVINKSLKSEVSQIIRGLPERKRMVLALYFYEELTLEEIGKVLEISGSRVSQILSQTLLQIRVQIEED